MKPSTLRCLRGGRFMDWPHRGFFPGLLVLAKAHPFTMVVPSPSVSIEGSRLLGASHKFLPPGSFGNGELLLQFGCFLRCRLEFLLGGLQSLNLFH